MRLMALCWCWCWCLMLGTTHAQLPPILQNRVALTNEHLDLRILYQPGATNPLALVVRDEDRGLNHDPTQVVLRVAEAARLELPAGFEVFGSAGDSIWVLPQSQNSDLLFLGVSAEGLPAGVFNGPAALSLREVRGPGAFFAWQFDGLSGLRIALNSRDGITPEDQTRPVTGSHEHFNWGFTSNGVYEVTFQVTARRLGDTNDLTSPLTTVVFAVDPLPPPPNPTPFETWQRVQWPDGGDPLVVGPDADPDHDGWPNLAEFFGVTDPRKAESHPNLRLHSVVTPTGVRQEVQVVGRADATDALELRLESSTRLPWVTLHLQEPIPGEAVDVSSDGVARVIWRAVEAAPVAAGENRFFRFGLRLK